MCRTNAGATPRRAERSAPIASRIGTRFPDASPTRTSATYIGGKTFGWCEIASAKLSPAENCRRNLACRRPHAADVGVGRQQFQCVVNSRAGAQQQSEIAGENRNVFRSRPRKKRELTSALDLRVVFLSDRVDRDQPQILDAPADFRRGRRRDRPADDLADLAQGAIAKRRHRHHRTVVTRSASATDVTPLRHLATASSIMVVMPALIAAASSAPDVGVRRDQVANLASDVENLEHAASAAISDSAATLAALRAEDRLASLETQSRKPRIGVEILVAQAPLRLAAVAKQTHEPLGDDRPQASTSAERSRRPGR